MLFTEETLEHLKHVREALAEVRGVLHPPTADRPVIGAADKALDHARDMAEVAREDLDAYQEYAEEHEPSSASTTETTLQEEVDRWERRVKRLRWARQRLRESTLTDADRIGPASEALDNDIRRLSRYLD